MLGFMGEDLTAVLASLGGIASERQLDRVGVSVHAVRRSVRSGHCVRLARGVVMDAQQWSASQPSQRHAFRARAAILSLPPGSIALSHHSSLAVADLPLYAVDRRVHLARTQTARGDSNSRVAFHQPVDPDWLIECEQQLRVRDSLAALQVADSFGVEAGLVAADAVAHAGVGPAEFAQALDAGRFARGMKRPSKVVELVDPLIESPGESRCRWLFHTLGMPVAEPQVEFTLASGRRARVDFLFRQQRTVVEFDGLVKYSGGESLVAEKVREDGLRDLGLQVVRLTWSDLDRPQRVQRALQAAFARVKR